MIKQLNDYDTDSNTLFIFVTAVSSISYLSLLKKVFLDDQIYDEK